MDWQLIFKRPPTTDLQRWINFKPTGRQHVQGIKMAVKITRETCELICLLRCRQNSENTPDLPYGSPAVVKLPQPSIRVIRLFRMHLHWKSLHFLLGFSKHYATRTQGGANVPKRKSFRGRVKTALHPPVHTYMKSSH